MNISITSVVINRSQDTSERWIFKFENLLMEDGAFAPGTKCNLTISSLFTFPRFMILSLGIFSGTQVLQAKFCSWFLIMFVILAWA